jgi:hypothetical protein
VIAALNTWRDPRLSVSNRRRLHLIVKNQKLWEEFKARTGDPFKIWDWMELKNNLLYHELTVPHYTVSLRRLRVWAH